MQQVSSQLKAELVQKLLNHEVTVFDIAAQYHLNPPTIYLWLREQEQFYTEAKLLELNCYNLSGQAYWVVAQALAAPSAAATQQVTAAPATPAAAVPEVSVGVTPNAEPSAEPSADKVAPSLAGSSPAEVATAAAKAGAADASAPEETAETLAPATEVDSVAGLTPTQEVATMAFPTPEVPDASFKPELGLTSGAASVVAPEQREAPAELKAERVPAPAPETEAPASAAAAMDVAAEHTPVKAAASNLDESEDEADDDDWSGDDWAQVDLDDDTPLELPTAPEAPHQVAAAAADDDDTEELSAELKNSILDRIERQEITVNAAADTYDVPQFMIFQWIAARKEQQAQAKAELEAKERAEHEAAAEAKRQARAIARAAWASEENTETAGEVNKGRRGPLRISGDRRIRLMALMLSGMSVGQISKSMHVSSMFYYQCVHELEDAGLLAWCSAQRELDQTHPSAPALLAKELSEDQPEINFSKVNAFKLAAVDAVLNQGIAYRQAADIFGVTYQTLYAWCKKAKDEGLEQWARGVGISDSDFAWLKPQQGHSADEEAAADDAAESGALDTADAADAAADAADAPAAPSAEADQVAASADAAAADAEE